MEKKEIGRHESLQMKEKGYINVYYTNVRIINICNYFYSL